MRISKITLVVLVTVLLLSVFVAKISNLLTVDFAILGREVREIDDVRSDKLTVTKDILGDEPDHLMWFVQVTDIHLSIFQEPSRISDFREFCSITVDAIKPAVVLASGDLTDAKTVDNMGSRQFVEEWEHYKEAVEGSKVTEKTVWLDIRGNHDNFNIPDMQSKLNYYHTYSVQGKKHPRSYMYKLASNKDLYSFIGIDSCLDPGPRRPFNFIGLLTSEEYHMLEEFDRRSWDTNFTIWFGHYPTSSILSPEPGVRQLMRHGQVYLCGHFHTLGGTVPNMYTLHHTGMLELELGDWKDNRLYRVAAFDHGLFSFIDVIHGDWPVILVTNPKHALFTMPTKEPLLKMLQSTHIRILVFSPHAITSVKVRVDKQRWHICHHVDGPLYTSPWNPVMYSQGIHELEVEAIDSFGHENRVAQPFSLDGTRLSFQFFPRLLLMGNVSMLFQAFFGFTMVLSVVPLCALRIVHKLVKDQKMRRPRCNVSFCRRWLRKVWLLVTVDRLFYPLIFYNLYLAVGPWVIGEIIDGHIGIVFAWGIIVNGAFLPGSFTYAYGFLQMLCFNMPLTFILAHCVDCRFSAVHKDGNNLCSFVWYVLRHVPFVILLSIQVMFAYFFWLAYGTMALFLGPLRSWSLVLALVLWHQSTTLSERALKGAAVVWATNPPTEANEMVCRSEQKAMKESESLCGPEIAS